MPSTLGSRRATLRDVAKRADVSIMTVSNVANGKTERVGEEARQRVLQAISELKYRPHQRGRSLRLARDFAIGLIILHPDRRFLNDPFNTEVAAGMSNYLAGEGYGLSIMGAQTVEKLEARLSRLSQLDAVAVFGFGDQDARRRLYSLVSDLHLPMMLIGDDLVDGLSDASYVRQENEKGAYDLAQTILLTGAMRILFIRPDHVWPAMNQRERGIRKAAKDRAEVETMTCSEIAFDTIVATVRDRLATAPMIDAVMGGNDMFGIATLHAAGELGLPVPEALTVTGFNGFDFRDYATPLLTSVRSPAYEIGREAARGLLSRIVSGHFEEEGTVLAVTPLPGLSVKSRHPDATKVSVG